MHVSNSKIPKITIAALVIAGCAVGPNFKKPDAPAAKQYTKVKDPEKTAEAESVSQNFVTGADISGEWWRLFNSDKLEKIIKDAMKNNPGLESAQASLKQSQDNLKAGYGIFYPQIAGDFSASRQRVTPIRTGQDFAPTIFNLFTLSASVTYALDIFGGERREVERLGALVDVNRANADATWLTLSANIVNTVIALAAYDAEVGAMWQIVQSQREQLKLAEAQEKAGTIPYASVVALQGQLAATQAAIPPLQQKATQAENLLASLSGHTPAEATLPDFVLTDLMLPKDLPVSLPSELAKKRPDILAAEAQFHAASAGVGVATAALFPSFTLSGAYGANSAKTNTLFSGSGNFWSYGVDVNAPIFQGGTLWYGREAAKDAYKAAAANYRQTVLSAFEQVADTLRALERDAEALASQEVALNAAQQNMQLETTNYEAGLVAYTDALAATVQYDQARVNFLQAKAVRYQDTVALFTALGGGWWNPQNSVAMNTE